MSKLLQGFFFPLLVSVLVGMGAGAVSMTMMSARHEERFTHLEGRIQRHETNFAREVHRLEQAERELAVRTDDQERRLAKLEGVAEETRSSLAEIRADIKTLLRGAQ